MVYLFLRRDGQMDEMMNGQDAVNEEECCTTSSHGRKSHHSEAVKNNFTTRLNRIEGQIRGIKGLIEKDTYCDDVITQIAATQSAMNSVAKILLEGHLRNCVVERLNEGDTEVIDEVLVTIQKLMKK
jgi:DNA-binding FrmR family transcriptional regulator